MLNVDGINTFLRLMLLARKVAKARGVSRSMLMKTGLLELSLLKWSSQSFTACYEISLFVYDETYFPP
jgi:hypothetical protein